MPPVITADSAKRSAAVNVSGRKSRMPAVIAKIEPIMKPTIGKKSSDLPRSLFVILPLIFTGRIVRNCRAINNLFI